MDLSVLFGDNDALLQLVSFYLSCVCDVDNGSMFRDN